MDKVDIAKRQLYISNKLNEFDRSEEVSQAFDQMLRESGWHEELKNYAKGLMRQKGIGRMDAESLADVEQQVAIKGKNTVKMAVRDELFNEVVRALREEGVLPEEKRYRREIDPY